MRDEQDDQEEATPGDAGGVPVPHEQALEGSSEESSAVAGVHMAPDAEQVEDDVPTAGDFRDLSKEDRS